MIEDPREHDSPSIKLSRPRPRFSLKSVFVVMTVLCLWLGYRMVRERRANEMIARHDQITDVLTENISQPPAGTFYRLNPGSQDDLRHFALQPGPNHWRQAILATGSMSRVSSWTLILDVSNLRQNGDYNDIAELLLAHYARSISKLRFDRRESTTGSNLGGRYASGVWSTKRNEFTFLIDATVSEALPSAEVRIRLIDAQQSPF